MPNEQEYDNAKNVKIKSLKNGIGTVYSINDVSHILIPVRRYANYEEMLLNTYEKMATDYDVLSITDISKKILIIGEDVQHIYDIFRILRSNKLLTENTYFLTDLKLYDNSLNKCFVRFGVKQENNQVKVIMPDAIIKEFEK